MSEELPRDFGNYELLDLIARGGMAEIYRAKMRTGIDGFEKPVAIKKILPNLAENEDFITMLIDEARISVSLNHANIAQVYDLGRVEDSYYIAMEYVPGIDLAGVIKKLGRDGYLLPLDHACFITKELCAGLYFAHRKTDDNGNLLGIVHRDISPHNVLVSFTGDVKIIDFGVAKASVKLGQTRMGVIKGKLLYMAPEQARAQAIDARADIFSVGLCLYRMLTGHLPFEADNEFQIYNNVLTKPIEPPNKLNPEIPAELNAIVMKALARDLDARYADGWLMHQDLEQVLQGVSPGYTAKRLSDFMNEYFADERPAPIGHSGRSSSRPSTQRAVSYPATPAATPSPSMPPQTPSNWQQPQPVAVGAYGRAEVQEPAFSNAGPTVPISGSDIAAIAQHINATYPSDSLPPLPSPEELGFKPSSAPLVDDEYEEGEPTVDMQLDPAMMNKVAEMVRKQEQAKQAEQAAQAAQAKPVVDIAAPTTPFMPRLTPSANLPPTPNTVGDQDGDKTKLVIALGISIVLLIFALLVAAFFGMSLLSKDSAPPETESKNTPAAVEAVADKDEPKAPTEAPPAPKDPTGAFKAAVEVGSDAYKKAARDTRAEVVIKITSEPAGAVIYDGRKKLGETPAALKVARSEDPVVFTLKLKGYQNASSEIVPSTDRSSVVVLEQRATPTNAPTNKGNTKGSGKGGEKTGDTPIIDPW